jgi:hypothetical protein
VQPDQYHRMYYKFLIIQCYACQIKEIKISKKEDKKEKNTVRPAFEGKTKIILPTEYCKTLQKKGGFEFFSHILTKFDKNHLD